MNIEKHKLFGVQYGYAVMQIWDNKIVTDVTTQEEALKLLDKLNETTWDDCYRLVQMEWIFPRGGWAV